jgi:hypothetical protein
VVGIKGENNALCLQLTNSNCPIELGKDLPSKEQTAKNTGRNLRPFRLLRNPHGLSFKGALGLALLRLVFK